MDDLVIGEVLYEVGDEVIARQISSTKHRLIHCKRPYQIPGKWVALDKIAKVGKYKADASGVQGGKITKPGKLLINFG